MTEEIKPGYIHADIRLQGNIQDLPSHLTHGDEWTIQSFRYGRDGVGIDVCRLAMRGEQAGVDIGEEYLIYEEGTGTVYNHLSGKHENVYPIRAAFLATIEEGQPVVGSTLTYITFEDDEALESHPAWKAHVENGYDDHPDDNYYVTDKVIYLWLRTMMKHPNNDE